MQTARNGETVRRMDNESKLDDPKLRRARQRVAALKGFYIHAAVYLLVNCGLAGINLATGAPWWFQWPLIGWGIGILGHTIAVFSPIKMFDRDWEEQKIKELMDKP